MCLSRRLPKLDHKMGIMNSLLYAESNQNECDYFMTRGEWKVDKWSYDVRDTVSSWSCVKLNALFNDRQKVAEIQSPHQLP